MLGLGELVRSGEGADSHLVPLHVPYRKKASTALHMLFGLPSFMKAVIFWTMLVCSVYPMLVLVLVLMLVLSMCQAVVVVERPPWGILELPRREVDFQ